MLFSVMLPILILLMWLSISLNLNIILLRILEAALERWDLFSSFHAIQLPIVSMEIRE
jgi:general stress protein CsbA